MDGVNIMSPTSVTSETEEESRDGEYHLLKFLAYERSIHSLLNFFEIALLNL